MDLNARLSQFKLIRMKDPGDFSHLNELRTSRKFCDITIKIGDRTFPCHRNVLVATMKYFRCMFDGNFVEAEDQEIELKDVNADEFEQILTFIYGGSILVHEADVLSLYQTAHYLGPQSLEDLCVDYIARNITQFSSDSILGIFKFASAMKNTTLVDTLTKSVAQNFSTFSKSSKLLRLSGSDLLRILTSKCTGNIFEKFDFLMNWVKYQSNDERKLLREILNTIGLPHPGWENWILKSLTNCDSATSPLDNEQSEHENEFRELFCDTEMEEHNGGTTKFPFSLLTFDLKKLSTISNSVSLHEFQGTNEIKFVGDCLPNVSTASFNSKSLLIGDTRFLLWSRQKILGVDDSEVTYDHHELNVYAKNSSWSDSFLPMKAFVGAAFERSKLINGDQHENILTAAVNDTRIYLYNNYEFLMYACERNDWFRVTGYKDIFAPCMLSLGSCLYMAGGLAFSHYHPITSKQTSAITVEVPHADGKLLKRYDVRENKWSFLPNMKYARSKAASCVHNNTIYVSGGDNLTYHNNYNVEYYDIVAGKWGELTTPMPKPKMGHQLVAHNDQLWFFGGRKPETYTGATYDLTWFSYDLNENTWSEVFTLPTHYGEHCIQRILDVNVRGENEN